METIREMYSYTSDTDSDSARNESSQACSSERPPSPLLPIGKEESVQIIPSSSSEPKRSSSVTCRTEESVQIIPSSSSEPKRSSSVTCRTMFTSDTDSDSARDESSQACSSERPPSPLLPIGKPTGRGRSSSSSTFRKLQQQKFSEALEPTIHKCGVTSMDLNTSGEEGLATKRPLGSLERTEVSLSHFRITRESRKLIRAEWGTRGTMKKIYGCIKSGSSPVDVHSLVSQGPVVSGQRRLIAARCFNSILKLKQHGLIKIRKDSETLEIKDIEFGDKIFRDE